MLDSMKRGVLKVECGNACTIRKNDAGSHGT